MKDNDGCLEMALGLLVLMIAAPIVNGFVIATFWSWFVVPNFDVVELKLPYAIGIVFIYNYLNLGHAQEKNDSDGSGGILIQAFIKLITQAVGALGFGWIVTWFI